MLLRLLTQRSRAVRPSAASWRGGTIGFLLILIAFLSLAVHQVSAQAAPQTSTVTSSATGVGGKFKYLGVNMWGLQNHDDGTLDSMFGYLTKCGVNTVRTFGVSERGGTASIKRVASAAGRHGIKIIVALADFPNGSAQMSGATGDPTAYYGGGYRALGYDAYVREAASVLSGDPNIAVVELANEPHCAGRADCLNPFSAWVGAMSSILSGKGFGVSVGTMLSIGGYDEPGLGFEEINRKPGITQASAHFYPDHEEEKRGRLIAAGQSAASLGKEMMMGEFGTPCNSSPCTNSSNDEARAKTIIKEMNFFAQNGYDGFLYWQFSGFKSNPLENDQYSWFAAGPEDVNHPICQALREGTFVEEEKPYPTMMYPKTVDEAEKYLANSQVYCAPRLILRPDYKGEEPPLGPNPRCRRTDEELGVGLPADARFNTNDEICDPYEYGITENTFSWPLGSTESATIKFPLFREESGGISIEADLSRLDPSETWIQAFKSQTRSDVAPALYLSSPVTQCQNITRFISYVQKVCAQYDPKTPLSKCGLNKTIVLPDGSEKKVAEFASLFANEAECSAIGQDIEENNEKAQALQSISPSTPRLFKMAFIAQHVYFHDGNLFADSFYMLQQIAAWFTSTPPQAEPFYGEQLDIFPVWYAAGIATDAFDQFADPQGEIRPYAFDPATLTGHDDAAQKIKDGNYLGPWTKTYEALLPTHFQEEIAEKRMRTVWENSLMMKDALKRQLTEVSVKYVIEGEEIGGTAPIECTAVKGGAPGAGCFCFSDNDSQCPNQTTESVIKAFPKDFEPVPNGPAFASGLKKLIIARIKSGFQQSNDFRTDFLSQRTFGKCPAGPAGGVQEEVLALGQNPMQNPDNILDEIKIWFKTKIVRDSTLLEQTPEKLRHTQTFLILPDEALTIEVAQAYIAPMFLSPQMYSAIMNGDTDLFPLKDQAEEQEREPFYSAFLRGIGFKIKRDSEQVGYALVEPTTKVFEVIPGSDGGCSFGNVISETKGPQEWIPLEDLRDLEEGENERTCENPSEVRYDKINDSTVETKLKYEDKKINENPEVPGQYAAMHEFLRRMAFTPHYMIQYDVYPGLEAFYGGEATGKITPPGSDTPVSAACVYSQPQNVIPRDLGYDELTDLRRPVCAAASSTGVPANLLRALLEVEGSPLLRAVRTGGQYTCTPNRVGAVGPMGVIVGQCSPSDVTKSFGLEFNTKDPDLCSPDGAIMGGARVAASKFPEVNSTTPGLSRTSPEFFARVAELYLGRGACGDLDNPTDGNQKARAGDDEDYCAYVSRLAVGFGNDFCSGI